MIGTPLLGAWIAHVAFWVLLVLGLTRRVIGGKSAAAFLALWIAGYLGLPRISAFSGLFVTPFLAVLDIVLAFIVFKGDIDLT